MCYTQKQDKVADEGMLLCNICYGGEMDALFSGCGHVVACGSCARPKCVLSVGGICGLLSRFGKQLVL